MKKNIACLAVCLFALAAVYAYMWPVNETLLKRSFGSNRNGSFLRGMEFKPEDSIVQAAADGELLFAQDSSRLQGGYPVAGGSIVAVAHTQDIISVYTGLERGTVSSYLQVIREGDILGRMTPSSMPAGASASKSTSLQFYTYDLRARRFIHPLSVMPIIADSKPPVIKSLMLLAEGKEIPAEQAKSIKQGVWEFLVDIYDVLPNEANGLPFSVILMFNGEEKTRYVFDSVGAQRGIPLFLSGAVTPGAELILPDGRLRLGSFTLAKGKTVVSIVASDFSGNKRESSWPVIVQ